MVWAWVRKTKAGRKRRVGCYSWGIVLVRGDLALCRSRTVHMYRSWDERKKISSVQKKSQCTDTDRHANDWVTEWNRVNRMNDLIEWRHWSAERKRSRYFWTTFSAGGWFLFYLWESGMRTGSSSMKYQKMFGWRIYVGEREWLERKNKRKDGKKEKNESKMEGWKIETLCAKDFWGTLRVE